MKHKQRNFKNKETYINSLKWLHSEIALKEKLYKEILNNDKIDRFALFDSTLTDYENLSIIENLIKAHIKL